MGAFNSSKRILHVKSMGCTSIDETKWVRWRTRCLRERLALCCKTQPSRWQTPSRGLRTGERPADARRRETLQRLKEKDADNQRHPLPDRRCAPLQETVAMSGTYVFIPGADGRRYCWARHPTYVCAHATLEQTEDQPAPAGVAEAARALSCDATLLARILTRAHASINAGRRREDSGTLSEDCAICGRRLQRPGFAYWIAAAAPKGSARARIAQRLGGDPFEGVEGPWYAKRKRDARAWAITRTDALKR